jgi:hypothetical protein
MKVISLSLTFLLFLLGCKNGKQEYVPHKNLIGVHVLYVGEPDNPETDEASAFAFDKISRVKYFEDYLTVTIWDVVNACGQYDRNIDIANDTIYLRTNLTSEEVCASQSLDKAIYFISNPQKEKYTVIQ